MNAVVEVKEPQLPAPVARRGIDEAQWRTAMNSLFPGAKAESVLMVFDYCKARGLDPLKKPCHIVPMKSWDPQAKREVWRDQVMPGIYEYRTTAMRTGDYCGMSEPELGPEIEFLGVMVPSYCKLVVYRWNDKAKEKCPYPAKAKFSEYAGTYWDKDAGCNKLNSRWSKAPEQMIEKCAEAAALRKAFPDELGGEHTAEEMDGQSHLQTEVTDITPSRVDPRGDTSGVDWEMRDKHVAAITDLCNEYGNDDAQLGPKLRDYVDTYLQPFPELYITVNDKLAEDGILTKANFKKLMKIGLESVLSRR
jgi:phage recombination protein Bet